MSLVAYDGNSSSSSSSSDEEEENPASRAPIPVSSASASTSKLRSKAFFEEDDEDDNDGADQLSSDLKFDKALPKPKDKGIIEEIGPIPPKKIYENVGEAADVEQGDKPTGNGGNSSGSSGGGPGFAKRQRGIVKISIPSLKDFEGDEEESKSKKKIFAPSKKGSGLFAILPEPKNSKPIIPLSFLKKALAPTVDLPPTSTSASYSLKDVVEVETSETAKPTENSDQKPTTKSSSLIPDSVRNSKRPAPSKLEEIKSKYLKQEANVRIVSRKDKEKAQEPQNTSAKQKDSDDSDDDEGGGSSFFSLSSKEKVLSASELKALMLPEPPIEKVPPIILPPQYEQYEENVVAENVNRKASKKSNQSYGLNEEVMRAIKRDQKREGRGTGGEINFIDINADQLKPEAQEWIKNITDTSAIPVRRDNVKGGVAKKKGQITFLASEAMAREEELKNEWAKSRQNRQQTKSKYGF